MVTIYEVKEDLNPTGRMIKLEEDCPLFEHLGDESRAARDAGSMAVQTLLYTSILRIVEETS